MTTTLERTSFADTELPEQPDFRLDPALRGRAVVFPTGATGGVAYREEGPRMAIGSYWGGLRPPEPAKVFFLTDEGDVIELRAPNEPDFTPSFLAPLFRTLLGTAELGREANVFETWYRRLRDLRVSSSALATEPTTPLLMDTPAMLQDARTRAGLPVQDLAAMFGIKRRQFYNWLSGEVTPEPASERQIARVTEAITTLSDHVDGNSRKARALLLARLEGDSVYEAAVSGETSRLDAAVERAVAVATEGKIPARRLPPSVRATPAEAAAVRDFRRDSRDEIGTVRDA